MRADRTNHRWPQAPRAGHTFRQSFSSTLHRVGTLKKRAALGFDAARDVFAEGSGPSPRREVSKPPCSRRGFNGACRECRTWGGRSTSNWTWSRDCFVDKWRDRRSRWRSRSCLQKNSGPRRDHSSDVGRAGSRATKCGRAGGSAKAGSESGTHGGFHSTTRGNVSQPTFCRLTRPACSHCPTGSGMPFAWHYACGISCDGRQPVRCRPVPYLFLGCPLLVE